MPDIFTLENKIKQMIDDLKGLTASYGLSNQASEENIITSVFLYKFLNDKFMSNLHKFAEEMEMPYEDVLNDSDILDAFYDAYPQDVAMAYEDTIECLVNKTTQSKFYDMFNDALKRISDYPRNAEFSIETADGEKKPLFAPVIDYVDAADRNNFTISLFGIISQDKFDFSAAFNNNFDFYSTIFEYLIKDYNVASGKYAEYFTPQAISSIIGRILVHMSPVEDKIYEIYDPSAGSGSLVLHLANELGKGSFGDKAHVFTQDISDKSTRFLRINMMLNGLTQSLDNIIKGDTLMTPAHYNVPHDQSSGVKQFDFITSNPPFKTDFSATRDSIESTWEDSEYHDELRRFFAGVPKIPNAKKESMAIYLMFIQHILWSLKDDGKAAIVVPTGFLTAKSGIEMTIRQTIVDRGWLKGVISMPSNVFANTGTNVSVIFIDKANKAEKIVLIDASKLGEKVKDGKNQRTVLHAEEVEKIINTFTSQEVIEDFSVLVTVNDIKGKGYSFSAGQYFEVKMVYVEITSEQFKDKIDGFYLSLNKKFEESRKLEAEIMKQIGGLKL